METSTFIVRGECHPCLPCFTLLIRLYRKGKDYTYLYGKDSGTGSLTQYIAKAFDPRVDEYDDFCYSYQGTAINAHSVQHHFGWRDARLGSCVRAQPSFWYPEDRCIRYARSINGKTPKLNISQINQRKNIIRDHAVRRFQTVI